MERIKNFIKKLSLMQRLLLAIAVVIILVILTFIINPAKKLSEMHNSSRRSNAQNILNAVYQYAADNKGALLSDISEAPKMICKSKAVSCEGMIDLSEIVVQKKYISSIPVDPLEKDPNSSGYEIYKSANGRLNVIAVKAENNAIITLSK
jgi:hypothetical protein